MEVHSSKSPLFPSARAILRFLIPVRLLMSPREMPSSRLLQSFGLDEYLAIAEALQTGSVATFNRCLEENMAAFIHRGVYFLVERLKMFVYRRLFRRVSGVHAQSAPSEAEGTRVPIQLFQAALAWQGEDMELDEVECILANLIYRGLIKGYLSHAHRKIVLMKGSPDQQFPLPQLGDKGLRLI